MIREQILNGKLTLPRLAMAKNTNSTTYQAIEAMFKAMWHAYLIKGKEATISTTDHIERIGNVRAANIALKTLSINGWITSKALPNNNWAEVSLDETKLLEYVSEKELASVRKFHKLQKYTLNYSESTQSRITKQGKNKADTGINRVGFMKTGNTEYGFDTTKMYQHKPLVIQQINKGIDKMIQKYPQIVSDLANYKEVGNEVVENLIYENATYTGGQRTNDPRGRNNRGDLSKIGNPIGFKIMRALLEIPESKRNLATSKGVEAYALFIAELNGFKNGTKADKIAFGEECYEEHKYPTHDADDMFENVWLERIYKELDNYSAAKFRARLNNTACTYKWSTPIEIDMSASVLGFISILLNHKPFMERCNMYGTQLSDAWVHDVITNRKQFKTIMRQCYGSQMTAQAMWDAMGIEYTDEEVLAFNHEMAEGELAVAVAFKDFIIQECNPQATMNLHVRDEHITVACNKHFNVGEKTTKYDVYDSATGRIRRLHHTKTKRVPDLKSFRRYFVTGLIHSLDGSVMSNTISKIYDQYNWVIDIHDAMILCPEAAEDARNTYAKELEDIHTNRKTILENYFRSIGIKASSIKRWNEQVLPLVEPLNESFTCNAMVLK